MSDDEILREAARIERQRDIETGRGLLEADWLRIAKGDRLHHATLTDDQCSDLINGGTESVTLTCGRVTTWACIPGVFSRMGCQRCAGCCDATGLPRGKGSPKNDDACRAVLGL